MKFRIALVYEDKTEEHTIEVRGRKMSPRMLDRIDDAVQEKFGDEDWQRWELRDIVAE